MKDIINFISEKLHISKDLKPVDYSTVKNIFLEYPDSRDVDKMKYYRNKGSDPKRLTATIKDKGKLERRFRQAIIMQWDAATDEFARAIVDRGYYSQDEIDKFLLAKDHRYNKTK